MQLNISQQMKMSQQMKLAPRMIQSMEILQMPLMVLQERIEQELEENVALEQVELSPEQEEPTTVEADDRSRGDDWERLSTFESSYGEATENEYSSARYRARQPSGERDRKLDA